MANKGEWVQISSRVLSADQRAPQVPEDTSRTPLVMWVKGYLLEEAEIGDEVTIETVTGRQTSGKLVEIQPKFTHSFGDYIPEITEIHKMLASELKGE
ncbi:2-amino-4-ketopentanoate thiolase [Aerococcaceae bacterium DSM 111020]|nr:2-amino-4-ketopentanoate thiolase [Aerococcaceae bacterium DSM 111020]